MASTEPLTGLTVQDNSDPANTGGAQIGNAVKNLAPLTVPRFASATARDTAWGNWVAGQAAGTKIPDGATCRLTSDGRLWRYDQTNSLWTWDKAAQGELTRVDFAPTGSGLVLSNSAATLPAFNTTVPLIPPRRKIQAIFTGSIHSDTAGTAYGFIMNIGNSASRRGQVQMSIAGGGQTFSIVFQFDSGNTAQTGVVTSVTGGRFWGAGTCYLEPAPDAPTSLIVNDVGGY